MTIICDSAQYSAMVSELGHPSYTGTCVTLQVGLGYCTTIPPLYLLAYLKNLPGVGWKWAFTSLTPCTILGLMFVVILRHMPRSKLIANGKR
jgi:hypothetical protein